ncbi:MAG: dodecin family protein [Candidatus Kariarchaeaceae archaeon]|jgi:flavin-binding protein dodecin
MESVYKIVELVGTSPNGWEEAVQSVVTKATQSLRDIRIVEVQSLDARVTDGKIVAYRAKVKLSFKFEA